MKRAPQLGAFRDFLTWLLNLGNPITAAPAGVQAMMTKLPGTSATPAQVLFGETMYPPPPVTPPSSPTAADLASSNPVESVIGASVAAAQAANQNFFNSQFPADIATPAPGLPDLLSGLLPDLSGATWILIGTAAAVVAVLGVKAMEPRL